MLYAIHNTERIEPKPGLKAVCPCCNTPVTAKCGEIKQWHWAHDNLTECDNWSEGMTEWHRMWQSWVPSECTEIVMGPHRADIVLKGTVIEIQHSPISPGTIRDREEFYGNMVWVFDGSDFKHNFSQFGMRYEFWNVLKEHNNQNNLKPSYDKIFRYDWKHKRRAILTSNNPLFIHFGGEVIYHIINGDYMKEMTIDSFFEHVLKKIPFYDASTDPFKEFQRIDKIQRDRRREKEEYQKQIVAAEKAKKTESISLQREQWNQEYVEGRRLANEKYCVEQERVEQERKEAQRIHLENCALSHANERKNREEYDRIAKEGKKALRLANKRMRERANEILL